MEKINVLSLFDGISCGRLALERAGIPINRYYRSEIDKFANAVAKKNYPDSIELGDVEKWQEWDIDFSKIDLVIGGSPCQGFSPAGKGLNFDDPRSKLFFDFVDILRKVESLNPKVKFLLENVKMKKDWQNIISDHMGVKPIEINSALVSAQNRRRLYWTNIKNVRDPEDKGILLKDIVHEYYDMDYVMKENWLNWLSERADYMLNKKYVAINPDKAITMTSRQYSSWGGNFLFEKLFEKIIPIEETLKILEKETKRGKIAEFNKGGQGERVYLINNKSVALCGEGGGRGAKTGLYLLPCLSPDKIKIRQNGRRFGENKAYTLTATDRHGILTCGYIRKLTPVECERLQTLPDQWTQGELNGKPISDSQRYKMLGNGWTVDVISHILKNLKEEF